jgi:hypothetical protein
MPANGASVESSPHEFVDAIKRTWFVASKFTPDIVMVHPVVNVHLVVPTNAPFIVNVPTLYK